MGMFVADVAKAATGAKVLQGTTLTTRRVYSTSKWMMRVVVVALALLALAVVIPASQAPTAERYYSVESKDYQGATQVTAASSGVSEATVAPQMSEEEALKAYGKLPLSFIPNEGQDRRGGALLRPGCRLRLLLHQRRGYALLGRRRGSWPRAGPRFPRGQPRRDARSPRAASRGGQLPGGGRPSQMAAGLPTHGELLYGGLWPGIDMAVRGEGGNLKYEFHVQPGSSVEDIRLGYRGAEGLKVGAGGELLVRTSLGTLKDAAPVSYQLIGGERVAVESRYKLLKGDGGLRVCGWLIRPSLPADHRPCAGLLHLPWWNGFRHGRWHRGGREW